MHGLEAWASLRAHSAPPGLQFSFPEFRPRFSEHFASNKHWKIRVLDVCQYTLNGGIDFNLSLEVIDLESGECLFWFAPPRDVLRHMVDLHRRGGYRETDDFDVLLWFQKDSRLSVPYLTAKAIQ